MTTPPRGRPTAGRTLSVTPWGAEPGGKMELVMQLIFTPFILRLMAARRRA